MRSPACFRRRSDRSGLLRRAQEVQRRARVEPRELAFIEAVSGFKDVLRAVVVDRFDADGAARGEVLEAQDRNAVLLADLVVVGRVHEREREDALLLAG